MAINQRIVLHLLSKLTSFNEWGQCAVLKLLEKYSPADDDELFSIMVLILLFPTPHCSSPLPTFPPPPSSHLPTLVCAVLFLVHISTSSFDIYFGRRTLRLILAFMSSHSTTCHTIHRGFIFIQNIGLLLSFSPSPLLLFVCCFIFL